MNLIYDSDETNVPFKGQPVKVGDKVKTRNGENVTVDYFRQPSSPASEGKVSISYEDGGSREFYVSVIGAKWVNREDRAD